MHSSEGLGCVLDDCVFVGYTVYCSTSSVYYTIIYYILDEDIASKCYATLTCYFNFLYILYMKGPKPKG